jgi:hypothetical protein
LLSSIIVIYIATHRLVSGLRFPPTAPSGLNLIMSDDTSAVGRLVILVAAIISDLCHITRWMATVLTYY